MKTITRPTCSAEHYTENTFQQDFEKRHIYDTKLTGYGVMKLQIQYFVFLYCYLLTKGYEREHESQIRVTDKLTTPTSKSGTAPLYFVQNLYNFVHFGEVSLLVLL